MARVCARHGRAGASANGQGRRVCAVHLAPMGAIRRAAGLVGWLCALALGLTSDLVCGDDEPVLSGQRAYLFDICPRSRAFDRRGAVTAPVSKYDTAATAATQAPALTSLFPGSGLVVLADWLDAPLETGARRWVWQHADSLAGPETPGVTSEPAGACLVLVGGRFTMHRELTHDGSDAGGPPPSKAQSRCPPTPDGAATEEARPCGSDERGPAWTQCWLDRYGLADRPEVYAEIAIEHSAASIRLRPELWEIAPPSDSLKGSEQTLHASFYAAIWLGGEELGLTAFKLPSRPPQVVTLLRQDFAGSGGLWLPVPARTGIGAIPISIVAVLHESRRESDADAHVVRALATARNASLPPMLPCLPTVMPGARAQDATGARP